MSIDNNASNASWTKDRSCGTIPEPHSSSTSFFFSLAKVPIEKPKTLRRSLRQTITRRAAMMVNSLRLMLVDLRDSIAREGSAAKRAQSLKRSYSDTARYASGR